MELPYAVLWLSVARSRRLDDSGGAYAVNRCFGDTWLLTAGGVVLGYAYGMRTAGPAVFGWVHLRSVAMSCGIQTLHNIHRRASSHVYLKR